MICYKFDDFVFNPATYQLTFKNKPLAVRPKALVLLQLLINNRDRVVSKSEIYRGVWGNTHERDHVLFQLVSELRKAPFKKEFIRTLPNQGYQWTVKTAPVARPVIPMSVAAASVLLALSLIGVALYQPSPTPLNSIQLPAQTALSRGVLALDSGDTDLAIEMFEFVLAENPDSVEASLFLGESLLKQNKPQESSRHLETLLQKPNLGEYDRMSASSLLSQVMERQGRLDTALQYAQNAKSRAVVAQCSIDVLAQRVHGLELQLSKVTDSPLEVKSQSLESSQPDSRLGKLIDDADPCGALQLEDGKTSSCSPSDDELYYARIAANRQWYV